MFADFARIVLTARATLLSDAIGLAAIAGMTLGLLHLPGLV